ncbi:MAG TPA: helix-turn-helix transcriptional regulator [Puia sp.]|nr:helix-turn-helix transcriptional regulator [Puia sp.]
MMQFLGKNIRYLRKQHPITQSQLASLIGKGQTTIGNWENGISEPNIEELLTLSNYFDISLDVLIKVDLAKTNYQLEKRRKEGNRIQKPPVKYISAEDVSVVSEQGAEGLSYVLQEIKALREEIVRIGALLPDAPASGDVLAAGGPGAGGEE